MASGALLERYRSHPGRGGCGVGAIVDLRGRASHELIDWALRGLSRLKLEMEERIRDLYVASFSPSTVVYKALATSEQLRRFYRDLADPDLRTDALIFHRRYSTNTFSNWYLAQVFRTLGHNGEI